MVFILACSISCRHLSCGFYSTYLPLKALPNIYHVPFLAVPPLLQAVSSLLSCVSPSSPSSILSCSSYLSVCRSCLPSLLFLLGDSICTRYHCLFMALWGRTPVHPAPSLLLIWFLPLPKLEWTLSMENISWCPQVKHVSQVFLACEKAAENKKEGESSQETKEVFPGEIWKEIGSQ